MFLDLIPLHALQVCFVRARAPHSSEAGCRMIVAAQNTYLPGIMSRHDNYIQKNYTKAYKYSIDYKVT